jgi:hypothetical protein
MISRLMWPLMIAKVFGPKSVPAKFGQFPKEMALRPSQIRFGRQVGAHDPGRLPFRGQVCGA